MFGLVVLGALAVGAYLFLAAELPERTTVTARDGSTHRVFLTTLFNSPGKGYKAESIDTGLHFAQGERVTIAGRPFAWQLGLGAFTQVAS